MNTPDTEWDENTQHAYDSILFNHNPIEADKQFGKMLEVVLNKLLTSRDTYWKERVRKEVDAEIADAVELTKREIKHRIERYFKGAYLSLKQQGGVHIHLEEIQEIIDDSTPPGFAPTPLQDK